MEFKKKTEIFVETNRQFIIRQTNSDERIGCPNCQTTMLTAEQAASFFAVSRRVVYCLVETESVHFTETETGAVMVCPASLTAILQTGAKKLTEE